MQAINILGGARLTIPRPNSLPLERPPLQPVEPTLSPDRSHLPLGGKTILPGLSIGHVVYHWIVQSFVVLLPEIQASFSLSAVGVGGLVSARELAAGAVALPGGIATDMVRRYWGPIAGGLPDGRRAGGL